MENTDRLIKYLFLNKYFTNKLKYNQMKRFILILSVCMLSLNLMVSAQESMTPELLWKLNRVSAIGISKDKKICCL